MRYDSKENILPLEVQCRLLVKLLQVNQSITQAFDHSMIHTFIYYLKICHTSTDAYTCRYHLALKRKIVNTLSFLQFLFSTQ